MESGHKPFARILIDVSISLGYPRILSRGSKRNLIEVQEAHVLDS